MVLLGDFGIGSEGEYKKKVDWGKVVWGVVRFRISIIFDI